MDQTRDTPAMAQIVRIIHAAMVAGVVLAAGVFAVMVRVRGPELQGRDMLRLVLPALGVGLVLVSASVLRRRVPERRSQQSPDAYWTAVENRGAAIILWGVTEGAALVSSVGYLLTGAPAAAAAAVIAIATLILYRPSRLERPPA